MTATLPETDSWIPPSGPEFFPDPESSVIVESVLPPTVVYLGGPDANLEQVRASALVAMRACARAWCVWRNCVREWRCRVCARVDVRAGVRACVRNPLLCFPH